jgi:radical SAM protein with 4Fe4S-binding SPASM domain
VNRHPAPTGSSEFPPDVIAEAARLGRLLTMEIEFSLRCNFRCPYCYVPGKEQAQDELSVAEIRSAILQARALGASRIIVLGGEPTIYPATPGIIEFIRENGLEVELFTNGTGVTGEYAAMLHRHQVRVALKMNAFDAELQNRLSGHAGAHRIIHAALERLKAVGYPDADHQLAISSVICRQNIADLPRLWRWAREQGIMPYFEIITPQADALDNPWLDVSPPELEGFFRTIAAMDERLFGHRWEIQPPLVGGQCMRHQYSCVVTARGDVMPCVGVAIPLGNIRERPLAEILAGSQVLKDLKNYRETIKGGCRTCDRADVCYGCRGAAFQLTRDYLASDPLCWRNWREDPATPDRRA